MFEAGLILRLQGADAMRSGLQKTGTAVEKMGRQLRDVGSDLKDVGGAVSKVGGSMLAAAAAPVALAGSMEAAFQPVKSLGSEAAAVVDSATDSFLRFQAATGEGADSYAGTLYNVISAGVEAADAVAVTEDALTGAKATMGDAASFAGLLGTALNNLADDQRSTADESRRFTDVITATQQAYQIESLEPLAQGFNYASAAAKTARLPVEQLFAALGMLNTAGVGGSRAGTSLTAVMGKLNAAAGKLGFTYETTADGGLDLVATLGSLADRIGDVESITPSMQDKLRSAFGEQGFAGLVPLLQDVEGLRDGTADLGDSAGVAMRAAAAMTDSFFGKLGILRGGFTSFFQASASGLMGPFKGALDVGIGLMARLVEKATENKALFGGLIAAVGGVGAALVGVGGSLWVTGALVENVGKGVEAAGSLVQKMGKLRLAMLFNPWALGLGALVAVGVAVYRQWDEVGPRVEAFKNGFVAAMGPVSEAFAPLVGLFRDGWAAAERWLGFGDALSLGPAAGDLARFTAVGAAWGARVAPAIEAVAGAFRRFWEWTRPARDLVVSLGREALAFGRGFAGGFVSSLVEGATESGGLVDTLRDLGGSLGRLWDATEPVRQLLGGLVQKLIGAGDETASTEQNARSLGALFGGGLVDNLTRAAGAVGTVVDAVSWLIEKMTTAYDRAVAFKDGMAGVAGAIGGGFRAAGGAVMDLFGRGAEANGGAAERGVSRAFSGVPSFLAQSPVKRGPLTAFNTAGRGLMELFASTVTPAPLTSALSSAFSAVRTPALAAALAVAPAVGAAGPPSAPTPSPSPTATASGAAPSVSYAPTVHVTIAGSATRADVEAGVSDALRMDRAAFARMLDDVLADRRRARL